MNEKSERWLKICYPFKKPIKFKTIICHEFLIRKLDQK